MPVFNASILILIKQIFWILHILSMSLQFSNVNIYREYNLIYFPYYFLIFFSFCVTAMTLKCLSFINVFFKTWCMNISCHNSYMLHFFLFKRVHSSLFALSSLTPLRFYSISLYICDMASIFFWYKICIFGELAAFLFLICFYYPCIFFCYYCISSSSSLSGKI